MNKEFFLNKIASRIKTNPIVYERGDHDLEAPEINEDTLKNLALEIKEEGARRVAVIVTDHTRPTPLGKTGYPVAKELSRVNVNVKVIVATGTHDPDYSLARFFPKIKTCFNTSRGEKYAYIGDTTGGFRVEVNTRVLECDSLVLVGTVIPHPWAGFSGGYKLILPGVSSRESIYEHHSKTVLSSKSSPCVFKENPFRMEIESAGELLAEERSIYTVNVVDYKTSTPRGYVGSYKQYYNSVVASMKKYSLKARCRHDLLILDPKPMSKSLYQALKAVENNLQVLEHYGSIILLALETESYGPVVFEELLRGKHVESRCIVPLILVKHLEERLRERSAKLYVIAPNLEPLQREYIVVTRNLDDALNMMIEDSGYPENPCYVKNASSTVLVYE